MCKWVILTKDSVTGPVNSVSRKPRNSCSGCRVILWGNSDHQTLCPVKVLFHLQAEIVTLGFWQSHRKDPNRDSSHCLSDVFFTKKHKSHLSARLVSCCRKTWQLERGIWRLQRRIVSNTFSLPGWINNHKQNTNMNVSLLHEWDFCFRLNKENCSISQKGACLSGSFP